MPDSGCGIFMYEPVLFPEFEDNDMKRTVWSVTKDLRPNLPITLRRVQSYTNNKTHSVESGGVAVDQLGKEGGFRTELFCLGKSLTIAPLKLHSEADWLLGEWIKQLDTILSRYELSPAELKAGTINSPDSFIKAVTQTSVYKEKYQEEATKENKSK